MHVGTHSHGQWQKHIFTGPPSRGERVVARHDQDNDGKLNPAELQGTKIGRRMSVDRFARLDRNDDGMLEASELSRKRARRPDGPSIMERVLVARFADHLAAKPEPEDMPKGSDVAAAVLARLDKDGSAGLNSEEIAGTRLAEEIGSVFYDLDGDKNGALDMDELTAFISKAYLGQSESNDEAKPALAADDAINAGTVEKPDVTQPIVSAVQLDAEKPISAATTTEVDEAAKAAEAKASPAAASSVAYADKIRASFEAALEVLRSGADQRSAYDVVRTLYAEVSGRIGEA